MPEVEQLFNAKAKRKCSNAAVTEVVFCAEHLTWPIGAARDFSRREPTGTTIMRYSTLLLCYAPIIKMGIPTAQVIKDKNFDHYSL